MKTRSSSRRTVAALLLLASIGLAGCATGAAKPPSDDSNGTDTAVVEAAKAAVEAGFAGNDGPPPETGPTAVPDKNIWILSAFEQIPGLAALTNDAREAIEAIGWTANVCDGQNNVDGAWAKCVRQAVAAGADGVILESIDCAPVKSALEEARAAGVLIASLTSFDCDDPAAGGGEPLFDVTVPLAGGISPADWSRATGELRAQWAIAQTDGSGKLMHVAFRGVAFGDYQAEGFDTAIAQCSGCDVSNTMQITPADVSGIRPKFETALLQAGEIDLLLVDSEFMMPMGVMPVLQTSNKTFPILGGECGIDNINYIHEGKVTACTGMSLGRVAWAAVDGLNRAFAGEDQVTDTGIGWYLVDEDHNLPAAGDTFDGPIDYRSAYRAIWK